MKTPIPRKSLDRFRRSSNTKAKEIILSSCAITWILMGIFIFNYEGTPPLILLTYSWITVILIFFKLWSHGRRPN